MIGLALLTNFIGVHTVLGAFVAGIMVGQSPILTRHIEEQLRGLIVALFMPVFFGVAGLSIDLKVLSDPHLLGVALLVIVIASIGKFGGCYLGSRIACLNHPESLAVGFAMNARGSTEIILATIGLSMGVLDQHLFTIIVVMAVVTTLAMPPMLRWALARVPMREEEKARMETEAAEQRDLMPKLERILVGIDSGANGRLAARLAGWLIGARRLTATVIHEDLETTESAPSPHSQIVIEAAENAASALQTLNSAPASGTLCKTGDPIETAELAVKSEIFPVRELVSIVQQKERDETIEHTPADAILHEAKKGYGLLFLGLRTGVGAMQFSPAIERIAREFAGPTAIFLNSNNNPIPFDTSLERILVPTTGADYSRFGAEVAVAIAKGCGATITALHVSTPPAENDLLRRPQELLRTGRALIADIVALGQREGVRVASKSVVGPAKEGVILRQARLGGHQLIVLGTKAWSGDQLHFGRSVAALIQHAVCPILIVKS
jgi:nucleotide-binding universal stress UspA family protein